MEENKKNLIKVSDFIANYLADFGVKYIHILMGGGAASLNDSFCKHPKLKYVCYNLENYGSYAAFGEAKFTGKLAVFNATSGIGAINTLPGILSAWGDGVPLLVVAGNTALKQTRRYLKKNGIDIHHNGVQDNDIVENVKNITKYSVSVEKSEDIKYELEKCIYHCLKGRPGPCLIEIPSDIASSLVEEDKLKSFFDTEAKLIVENIVENEIKFKEFAGLESLKNDLKFYQRPLILAGGGIRQSNTLNEFKQFIEKYELPFVNTFLSVDLLPYSHPLNWGCVGVKGKRNANFALQNADLLLILGCSLQTAHIGYLPDKFAYRAKKIQVDLDNNILDKNIIKIDEKICCDLREFFRYMNKYKLGEKYWLKVFTEPEEMEYIGEVKSKNMNCYIDIRFQAFRRYSYNRPDLIALYNEEFFTRSQDNTVEGLTKAVADTFRFKGIGYKTISVGMNSLTIEEFKEQTKDLLTPKEIEESILNGRYFTIHRNGEVKWCPKCQKIRQTSCSACGCGSCSICNYRWTCYPQEPIKMINLQNNCSHISVLSV